jgi:hypothetical protein
LGGCPGAFPKVSDIGPIDPFGFSWPVAVSRQKPSILGVGFVWISLDSLVRIMTFQWVTRIKRAKLFIDGSGPFEAPESVASDADSQNCSWRECNQVSGFLQEFVVRGHRHFLTKLT